MKRTSYRAKVLPDCPKHVPLDTGAVERFHSKVSEDTHAAFDYVESPNQSQGWFERGVIEEVKTQDGTDRITLRTIGGTGDDIGEQHYMVYLDSDGDYDEHILVYARDPSRDQQPTLGSDYPEPGERFDPEELPGCEEIGYLVGGGVLDEHRFHEAPPTEEFWSVPESVRVFFTYEDRAELSVGIVNRTGNEQPIEIDIDLPNDVEWEDKHDDGRGVYSFEGTVDDNRQHPVTLRLRHDRDDLDGRAVEPVTVTLTLGEVTETFEHQLVLR